MPAFKKCVFTLKWLLCFNAFGLIIFNMDGEESPFNPHRRLESKLNSIFSCGLFSRFGRQGFNAALRDTELTGAQCQSSETTNRNVCADKSGQ